MSQQANSRSESPGAPAQTFRPGATDAEQARLLALLDERLRFESLLSRLSTTFINLPADEIDGQIERGLQRIVEFLQIDRSGLAQFSEDGSALYSTHSYTAPGIGRFPPWTWRSS